MLRPALLALGVLAAACSAPPGPSGDPGSYDDNSGFTQPLPEPLEASTTLDDGGVLGLGNRPNDGGVEAAADAGDAGPATACVGPLAPGDLAIVELMIASVSGTGDRGEWVELKNTRSCVLDLNGLVVQSPRGTSLDKASVATDVFVQPGASVVVADSASATDDHDLPAAAVVATFGDYDVLKNGGDTVEVWAGTTLVDALTYPQLAITPGRSVSFPADCAPSDRGSWSRWSSSFNVWSSPFQGTPGADNTDVTCY